MRSEAPPPAHVLSPAVARAFASRRLTFDAPTVTAARSHLTPAGPPAALEESIAALAVLLFSDPASPGFDAIERAALRRAIADGTADECLRTATLVLYRLAWLRGTAEEWRTLDAALGTRNDLDAASPTTLLTWLAARALTAIWLIDGPAGQTAADSLHRGAALAETHGIDPRRTPLATSELILALVRRDEAVADRLIGSGEPSAIALPAFDASQRSLLLAWHHLNGGRGAAAEAQAARAVAFAQRSGVPVTLAWAQIAHALTLAALGRRTEALRSLGAAGHLARELHADHVSAVRAHLLATLAGGSRRLRIERGLRSQAAGALVLPFVSALAGLRSAAPALPTPRLVIRTLGTFTIEVDHVPLRWSGKTPRRPLEVLKLTIASGGEVPVDRVLDALWPGHEADKAYRALVSALHRLRQLIGESTIELRDGALRLRPDHVWVDALAFERNDEQASLDLYAGPFLHGEEADWVIAARERLRVRHAARVEDQATPLVQAGRHADALALYMRALDRDPLREGFYQSALGCCAALGLRAESSALYERCRSALAHGLGLRPSPQTEALYREIVSGRQRPGNS